MRHLGAALVFLAVGTASYWLFRPDILLFSLVGINPTDHLPLSEGWLSALASNHLADAMWCLAVCRIADLFTEKQYPFLYSAALMSLPFLSEIIQAVGWREGVFDWLDLLLYVFIVGGHLVFRRAKCRRDQPIMPLGSWHLRYLDWRL